MNIGKNIAELRKAKGSTQDELAAVVNVSAQAVSKWENGGSPDSELLPSIADFFEVPIDRLFGLDAGEKIGIIPALEKYFEISPNASSQSAFLNTDSSNRNSEKVFELLWLIERYLVNGSFEVLDVSLKPAMLPAVEQLNEIYRDNEDENGSRRMMSATRSDSWTSLMSLMDNLQYFFYLPWPKDGVKAALPPIEEYQKLFAALADTDVLNAVFDLIGNEALQFTPKHFEKNRGISPESAVKVTERLLEREFLHEQELELDETTLKYYSLRTVDALIPFLVLAREVIHRCSTWIGYNGGRLPKGAWA
jgi:transcriptional regulator with XRE-family HTH domain